MYTLIERRGLSRTLTRELPALLPAWLIAEFCYKFHSFTLECAAFMATWYVLSWALGFLRKP